ncbi:hypothetical protein BCR44DRAFT_1430794 [Catenaria anguillulae PL171]|uniref:PPM-type phosphatase domain-containing protein n=1 Tax=Catenaria anguillulae PL171 TaxID=765915 RepID=A0A1Y2HRN9_9FUNG|nr:hypothetical protein BCR44DRAFT_1430794 [Catenaria anguillulae PL171]
MGGRGLPVLLIDTDLRVDLVRLHSRLVSHAIRCASTAYPSLSTMVASDTAIHEWAHQLALETLARLHLVRATNHMQLLATLHLLTAQPHCPRLRISSSIRSLLLARHFARLKVLGVTTILTTWERHIPHPRSLQHHVHQPPPADPFGFASMVRGDMDAGQKVDAEARERLGRHLASSIAARFLVRRAPPVVNDAEDEDDDQGDKDHNEQAQRGTQGHEPTYIAVQMMHPVVRPGHWVVVTSDGVCDYQPDDV